VKSVRQVSSFNLYTNQSYLKWLVLLVSVLIGVGSIWYTNLLVDQIREREKRQISLYAKTLEYLASENENRNLIFLLEEIVQANTTIPVILADAEGNPEFFKNLRTAALLESEGERQSYLKLKMLEMAKDREPIKVVLTVNDGQEVLGEKYIYYESSQLLLQLQYYPYVQLMVIALFGLITYVIFNYSRAYEQNRVWVGLAKETAHQLGTPISSLLAWIEYLKSTYPQDEQLKEIDKDIRRLEEITMRFSSIGSEPKLISWHIGEIIEETVLYLRKRISQQVKMEIRTMGKPVPVLVNPELFSWVLENLCKNAVDAMEGSGSISILINQTKGDRVIIDIKDNGKGISRKHFHQVFKPGYTTKKRGWGLGLSLVKRIIENYHRGKIFVKESEPRKGTTFRIVMHRFQKRDLQT
jgi:signal transduction histidine kinase